MSTKPMLSCALYSEPTTWQASISPNRLCVKRMNSHPDRPFSRTSYRSLSANRTNSTPLVQLADQIASYAHKLSDYYTQHDILQPSFGLDGPEDHPHDLPDDIRQVQARLRSAATDMSALAAGPKQNIMAMAWSYHDVSLLHYVHHFRVAEAVPLVGNVSIEEVATATGTAARRLKRVLRLLALHHIFTEPAPGRVAHTPASRQLVTSEHVRSWVGVRTEETGQAAFGLVAALDRWGPDPQELNETAYSHVHSDGKLSRFDMLALPEHRHRQARFANLMGALQDTAPYDLKHTAKGYPWQKLGRGAVVVDVGGSTGSNAQALVRAHPNLRVIVQDLPDVVEEGRRRLPDEFSTSIEFMEYDFRGNAQPVRQAAAYCFRQIFHDWPDKYASVILRNTADVMQPGQKIVIVDVVMPETDEAFTLWEQKVLRQSDMEMMVQFNALERESVDWHGLIKMASPRLQISNMHKPKGSANCIIEIELGEFPS